MNVENKIEPNRRRKASKEERRRQLIEATIATIAKRGISGTTTTDVTRAAGLSAGIVSLHFDGKEGLLTETLKYLAQEHREVWVEAYEDESLTTVQKLGAVVDANFDQRICTREKVAAWFAYFGEAKYREVYRELVKEFDVEREDALATLCAELCEDGDYESVDSRALASCIESLADGFWLRLALYPDWEPREELKHRIYDMIAAHLPKHFQVRARSRDAA